MTIDTVYQVLQIALGIGRVDHLGVRLQKSQVGAAVGNGPANLVDHGDGILQVEHEPDHTNWTLGRIGDANRQIHRMHAGALVERNVTDVRPCGHRLLPPGFVGLFVVGRDARLGHVGPIPVGDEHLGENGIAVARSIELLMLHFAPQFAGQCVVHQIVHQPRRPSGCRRPFSIDLIDMHSDIGQRRELTVRFKQQWMTLQLLSV